VGTTVYDETLSLFHRFLITRTVGRILGREIGPLQGRNLHRTNPNRVNVIKLPGLRPHDHCDRLLTTCSSKSKAKMANFTAKVDVVSHIMASYTDVRFEFFTAVTIMNAVIWDIKPCGFL
jgi:hypothetical protein